MEKRCTIKTIAAKLGVAPSTVSRAFQPSSRISDAQRALILKTAKEMNYVPNQAASRLNQREIRVGILLQSVYPVGIKELRRGIEDGYRSLSDYKISYHIELFDTKTSDTAEYCRSLFESFADDDALILSGIKSDHAMKELEAFSQQGKAVVFLQSGQSFPNCLFRSMHDPAVTARMAAEFLANCLEHKASRRVILLTGNQAIDVHSKACEAFLSAAKSLSLEVTAVYDMADDHDVLEQLTENVLTPEKLAETDGIYITSGKCIPLCRHLEACGLGNKIALVTFDVSPELHPYLLRRTVNATIYQNMYRQAFNAFVLLVQHLMTHQELPEMVCPNPEIIMGANLSLYTHP